MHIISCSLHNHRLDLDKIKKTGELYNGQKALGIVSRILGFLQLAIGIWAFVYALSNKEVKDNEECAAFFWLLLVCGIICLSFLGLMVVGGIGYAIYTKVKGGSDESS